MYWCANQTICIRCGSQTSEKFHVSNGVRQGSILSPYLFKVYVDLMFYDKDNYATV